MLTKVNILNVSIWSLGGLLLLFAIILIILRTLNIDIMSKIKGEKEKDVGKVSKDMQQLILSLDSIYDINVGYNILFKNKFSEHKYSLIPAICERDKIVFLIANRIKINKKKTELIIKSDKKVEYVGKKNVEIQDFKYIWYRDIPRYIRKLNSEVEVKIILPILGDVSQVRNHSDLIVLDFSDIGEYISKYKTKNDKRVVLEKLQRINLFKGASRLDENRAKGLMK